MGLISRYVSSAIHPTTTYLLVREPETAMLPEIVTDIIDEVVPLDERGELRMARIEFAGVLRVAGG